MSDKEVDLDVVKFFYNPHPGLMGAVARIPEAVRVVANDLNGKSMPLREAVAKIKAATTAEVVVSVECVLLRANTGDGNVEHVWRVIKFRD